MYVLICLQFEIDNLNNKEDLSQELSQNEIQFINKLGQIVANLCPESWTEKVQKRL